MPDRNKLEPIVPASALQKTDNKYKAFALEFLKDTVAPKAMSFIGDSLHALVSSVFGGGSANSYTGSFFARYGTYTNQYCGNKSRLNAFDSAPSIKKPEDCLNFAFKTRIAAENVLADLYKLLARYRVVRIMDVCDLAGVKTVPGCANYGWVSLDKAYISESGSGGYIINFPKAMEIEQ